MWSILSNLFTLINKRKYFFIKFKLGKANFCKICLTLEIFYGNWFILVLISLRSLRNMFFDFSCFSIKLQSNFILCWVTKLFIQAYLYFLVIVYYNVTNILVQWFYNVIVWKTMFCSWHQTIENNKTKRSKVQNQ